MQLNLDDGDDIGVEMGPLVDCVFLLLIFFLVSTTMKKPEPEILVNLPGPALAAVERSSAQVQNLAVDAQGKFYWSGVPLGQQELHAKLREFGESTPDDPVRIKVDRDAPAQLLVQVIDLCAYEGLTNYALHTQSGNVPSAKELEKANE